MLTMLGLSEKYINPGHVVAVSPWPLTTSIGFFCLVLGWVSSWHFKDKKLMIIGGLILVLSSVVWWGDCLYESLAGFHNQLVASGFRLGMLLFILSEVLFFFSFFWGFFHKMASPSSELGYSWPPCEFDQMMIDPFSVPLLKTMVLLTSGATVTWAHHSMVSQDYFYSVMCLGLTSFLGVYFIILQVSEYMDSVASINSSMYGSTFFMLTGFHGAHVTMGTVFLFVCMVRSVIYHFSSGSHVGFEMCAWYWHFVDVVWLFLYAFVYWCGFVF